MQILTNARDMETHTMREPQVDPAAVDAVLTASRSMVAVATRSLGAAAEETTIAQYRALVVLASRGPQRIVDLAESLEVAPSTAGRMGDRLVRKGLVRRHRARGDRRVVLVSVTPAGRQVVDEATRRRRALIADILARLPVEAQRALAEAFREFADAAGEIPDSQWPVPVPADEGPVPRPRAPARPGGQGQPTPTARGRLNVKEQA
jgi:DNA-binding MarR family transcriptional regulator